MNHEQRKARIRWHSRRGMLELDVFLERFLDKKLEHLSEAKCVILERLLTEADPDLYAWLMGYETPANEELADFVAAIRSDNRS